MARRFLLLGIAFASYLPMLLAYIPDGLLEDFKVYNKPQSPPEGDLIALTSGFYGPGAVLGWLLSCVSFLLSHAKSSKSVDALDNDFLVAMLYPAVACGDLLVQVTRYHSKWRDVVVFGIFVDWKKTKWKEDLTAWESWILDPERRSVMGEHRLPNWTSPDIAQEIWALPYTTFACTAVVRIALVFFCSVFIVTAAAFRKYGDVNKRTLLTFAVMILCVVITAVEMPKGWITYAGDHGDYSHTSTTLASDLKVRLSSRYFIFSDLGLILIVFLATGLLVWRRRPVYIFAPMFVVALLLGISMFKARKTPVGKPQTIMPWGGNVLPVYYTEIRPSFLKENPLLPVTAASITDLDQAVALAAGAATVLFTIHDVMSDRNLYARGWANTQSCVSSVPSILTAMRHVMNALLFASGRFRRNWYWRGSNHPASANLGQAFQMASQASSRSPGV
jgi:hypothetical protein